MKKLVALLITVVIIIPSILCSCSERPSYYYPSPLWQEIPENVSKNISIVGEPSEAQIASCKKIFDNLCKHYCIEKSFPEVKITNQSSLNRYAGFNCSAMYDDNCIYMLKGNVSNKDVLAHELCHYLSDDGEKIGFDYILDDGIYTGHYLTEGINNYFSSELYSHQSQYGETIYEFETHIASLLAIVYGEENLRNDFFAANVNNIKDDFNKAVKGVYYNAELFGIHATPFDIFAGCLDSFGFLVYECDDSTVPDPFFNSYNEAIGMAMSLEEMVIFYAKGKGKEIEVMAEIESYMEIATMPANFQVFIE